MIDSSYLTNFIIQRVQNDQIRKATLVHIYRMLILENTLHKTNMREQEGVVFFQNQFLDLRSKPKLCDIFKFFMAYPSAIIPKEQLLAALYGIENVHESSERKQISDNHNVIKLMSRARKLANAAFKLEGLNLEWFVHSTKLGGWMFYTIHE